MKKRRNKNFTAFTLAEILITLSIIGVVAALTIPTLIQRTGNEELVSRLHKTYSTLSQATEAIMTENGNAKAWAVNLDNVYELYRTHLRNSKECGSKSGCFKQFASNSKMKMLNGTVDTGSGDDSRHRNLILSDGTQIVFGAWLAPDGRCSYSDAGIGSNNFCFFINVDINGEKTPNQYGRDFFYFVVKENGLYPGGCDAENIEDVCSISNPGRGCACRVISEGAMNY